MKFTKAYLFHPVFTAYLFFLLGCVEFYMVILLKNILSKLTLIYKVSQDIFCYDSKVGYWHGLSQNYENRPESFKTFLMLIFLMAMMIVIRNGYVKKCYQDAYTQSAEVDES